MELWLKIAGVAAIIVILVSGLYYIYAYMGNSSPSEIVVGVELNDHSAAFWVALDKGYFEEVGLGVDYKTFSTGLELAVALSRDEFDLTLACVGPVMVMYSRGVPVKLVAMTHLNGYALVTGKSINSIDELKDAKVSATGPGSPTWLLAMMVRDRYELNFTWIKMPPYIAVNALLTNQIDAAFIPEHYATLAEKLGAYRVLMSRDLWPNMPGSGVFATEELLEEHSDIVAKFIYAINRAVEFIKNHPHEAAVIVAKHLASSTDIMEESMQYLDYTLEINKTALEEYAELLLKYGALDHEVNVDDFIYTDILGDLGIGTKN
ncbi:MAG: ABC transporter substrate-binding protein [Staphylothermus sp.]|nr:ABC transporter substrate-binding protein [Staphylothermus sp.]